MFLKPDEIQQIWCTAQPPGTIISLMLIRPSVLFQVLLKGMSGRRGNFRVARGYGVSLKPAEQAGLFCIPGLSISDAAVTRQPVHPACSPLSA
jgi:hypothetical protein